MSHLRGSDLSENPSNASHASAIDGNVGETNDDVVPIIATPTHGRRRTKPKHLEDYHVGKRQKRESDTQFFRSVGHDPILKECSKNSRQVFESLDSNVCAASAPPQGNTRNSVSRGSAWTLAEAASLVTPAANDVGISNEALCMEPVKLNGGDTDENFCRPTKQSFLHQSSIYGK